MGTPCPRARASVFDAAWLRVSAVLIAVVGAGALLPSIDAWLSWTPLLSLVGVPLMIWPFKPRVRPRRGPAPGRSAPPPAPSAPPPQPPASPPVPVESPFGRAPRGREGAGSTAPPPAMPPPGAPARPAPPVRPVPQPITGPAPRVGPVNVVDTTAVKTAASATPARAGAPPSKSTAAPTPPTSAPAASSKTVANLDIRIPFARVADQFPRDVFMQPTERLGASLREPNVLVIPVSVVTPQLAEGSVEVEWAVIEAQFPALASALPAPALRARFVGWRLQLPMDEVVRQLPPDVFAGATSVNPRGIDAFPPPFEPFSAGDSRGEAPASAASMAPPLAPPPRFVPPAPAGAAPTSVPIVVAPAPSIAAPPNASTAAPAPPRIVVPPAAAAMPSSATAARPSDAAIAEARAIAAELARGGAFETALSARDGVTIAAFTAPGVSTDVAERLGRRAAPLVGGGACVAVRAAHASIVAARGRHAVLAAAMRPTALIAWADGVLGRAADGGAATVLDDAASLAPSTHTRLVEAAVAFSGVGPAPAEAFVDATRGLSLYVVSATDARGAAALARRVWDTLLREPDAALGAVSWVTVRRGAEATIVRPLGSGRAEVLVAVADGERLGLAHRQAERAAAVLEGR